MSAGRKAAPSTTNAASQFGWYGALLCSGADAASAAPAAQPVAANPAAPTATAVQIKPAYPQPAELPTQEGPNGVRFEQRRNAKFAGPTLGSNALVLMLINEQRESGIAYK